MDSDRAPAFSKRSVRARREDSAAVALFSFWPQNPDSPGPGDNAPALRRLIFIPAEAGQPAPGGFYVMDEKLNVLSHTQTGGPVRYQDASFAHYSFEEVADLLGTSVPAESYAEARARAQQIPGWDRLEADTGQASDDAYEGFRAQLREWGID